MEKNINEVKNIVNNMLDEIDNSFLNTFRNDFSFGKMLRSKLILSIAPNLRESIRLCGIIELIHFASLLHDDVIDNSILRRGKVSINAKYGDKIAIMLGDILYSKAFYEASLMGNKIALVISDSVLKLSLGELEDVSLAQNFNYDEKKYIHMITYKTAALIESSAVCAGILINGDLEKYSVFGSSLGVAFQIIDDLLDITQDSNTLGKNHFSDFSEGKTTLPYIYLYNMLDEKDKNKLTSMFNQEINDEQKQWVTSKINEFGIPLKVKEVALEYGNRAISVLDNNDFALKEIVNRMIFREF